MKRYKLWGLFCLLIFILGLIIFFYPQINRLYMDYRMENAMDNYITFVKPGAAPETLETVPVETQFVPDTYQELWYDIKAYNQKIWEEKQSGLTDARTYEKSAIRLDQYGMDQEVFGILKIPRLELEMPLYLGASWQHMADGAAQLGQTSIPIGGVNTNSVIAGHRGWKGAVYFRNITDLQIGDTVTIVNPWSYLWYTVTEIKIVEPNDVGSIHIQTGRDLVTLLTCHPYASGGRQRYLVICERSDASF